MKITEVRIFPTESKDGKLKAFATMTFDDWFVVRNVKVIQGNNGLFVAMPSRKAMDSCSRCNFKNVVGSKYCNQCGSQLEQKQAPEENTRETYGNHMDIAHPITQECRVYIQEKILDAYNKEAAQGSGTRSGGTVGRKRTESAQQALNTRKKPKSEESFSEPATSGGVDMSESKVAGKKFGPRQDEETPDEIDSKDIEL